MGTTPTRPRLLFVVVLAAAVGCSDDKGARDDDTFTDAGASPCAAGFRQDPELPLEFYDDFPDGCVPQECGIGRWGGLQVDEDTFLVDVHAGEGGDGSEQAPFTSIQDGLDAAGDGGARVVVAAGIYVENLLLTEDHDGVRLAGRCREMVVVDASSEEEDERGVLADGYWGEEEWWVSGLTVTGAPYSGIWLDDGNLNIHSSSLVGNRVAGALAVGGSSVMVLSDVDVLDTRPQEDGTHGRGINVEAGARLEAFSCQVAGNTDVGIFASSNVDVVLWDVEVRDTQPDDNGAGGRGIVAQYGARLDAYFCSVSGNADIGILASQEGTDVVLRDVEVSDTRPLPDGTLGRGIEVNEGARLNMSSSHISGNAEKGVFAADGAHIHASSCQVHGSADAGIFATRGAEVVLHEVEVLDTTPLSGGTDCAGIAVQDGALLEATACRVSGNAGMGINASSGAVVFLNDVEVGDTQPLPDGTSGCGIHVLDGAVLVASSCLVSRNADVGVVAGHVGTEVVLQDVEVRDTLPGYWGSGGRGINVQEGARLEAISCLVSDNSDLGIFVSLDAEAILRDVEVWDTSPVEDGTGGRGINVQSGSRLDAADCLVSGNTSIGVYAGGVGTEVVLRDVEVWDTQPGEDGTGGRGINVHDGARLEASSCLVSENGDVGIMADNAAEVILEDVEVRDTRRVHLTTVAQGVVSQVGADISASYLLVSGTEGTGLMADALGTLSCTSCNLADNTFAGALARQGGSLYLSGTNISGTRSDANEGGGFGVYAAAWDADYYTLGPSVALDDVTIEDQPYAALWLDGDGSYSVTNSTLVGGYGYEMTYPDGTSALFHGDSVVVTNGASAWDGAHGLMLQGNEIRDAVRAGVLLDSSSAELEGNIFTNNGVDLIWQDCDGVDEPGGLAQVPVVYHCPIYNHHVAPIEFNLYLEETEPCGRENTARPTAVPATYPSMPRQPTIRLHRPLPMAPSSASLSTLATPTCNR